MLDGERTGKMIDRKKSFLHHSINKQNSLNSDVYTTQEEKGKTFQNKLKNNDRSIVRKSCIDVASSSNMNINEYYY